MPDQYEERRKSPRFKQRMLLKYRCVSEGDHKDSKDRVGLLGDLSRGGIVIKTKEPYPTGVVLSVNPPQSPIFKARNFHVKVQWINPLGAGEYQIGCSYVKYKKK